MNHTFTYTIGENLYINLTNRCTNRCTFCVREGKTYEGYDLWLEREPTAAEVIAEIGDPKRYHEVVFCGFGEPTERLETMLEICVYVHANGGRTRLNTNGHGSILRGEDIAPRLKGQVDFINISMNASSEAGYNALCRPAVNGAFCGMLAFAKRVKACGIDAVFSVVDCIGEEEIARCRERAKEAGLPLKVRETIEV